MKYDMEKMIRGIKIKKKKEKWFCTNCEYCILIDERGFVLCEHSAFKTERDGDIPPVFENGATFMDAPAYCRNYTKRKKRNAR
jgi:hypothetical protein